MSYTLVANFNHRDPWETTVDDLNYSPCVNFDEDEGEPGSVPETRSLSPEEGEELELIQEDFLF